MVALVPLAWPMHHSSTLLNKSVQNFPIHGRRSASPTAPSSVMALNESTEGTNIATLSMLKVLIASSTLLQKKSVLMWQQKLFLMLNAVMMKILLLLLMLTQSRFAACSRMLCQMLQHKLPLLHFVKKLMNSIVEGSRSTTTMSQLLKMLGPNHQHPLDNGLFLPYAVVALTPKYLMQEERNLERWGGLTSSGWPSQKNLLLK